MSSIWEDAGFPSLYASQFLLKGPSFILCLCSLDYLRLLYLSSGAGPTLLAVSQCSLFRGEGVRSLLCEGPGCCHMCSVTAGQNWKARRWLSCHCRDGGATLQEVRGGATAAFTLAAPTTRLLARHLLAAGPDRLGAAMTLEHSAHKCELVKSLQEAEDSSTEGMRP